MDRSLTTSDCMSSNPCPVGGLKQTPACPEHDIPAALWRVIEADGNANSASRFDWTGLLRPSRDANNPISEPGSSGNRPVHRARWRVTKDGRAGPRSRPTGPGAYRAMGGWRTALTG